MRKNSEILLEIKNSLADRFCGELGSCFPYLESLREPRYNIHMQIRVGAPPSYRVNHATINLGNFGLMSVADYRENVEIALTRLYAQDREKKTATMADIVKEAEKNGGKVTLGLPKEEL